MNGRDRLEDRLWVCRAEGIRPDGQLLYAQTAVSEFYMRSLTMGPEEEAIFKHTEREVLVKFFHKFDQVPYRIYWMRGGREWLQPQPLEHSAVVEWGAVDGGVIGVEIKFRDTRDHTLRTGARSRAGARGGVDE